jgi:hypothetical protein
MERFWMVMRASRRRPKVHMTLQEAQEEARRIAANNPGTDIWVIRCETIATYRAEEGPRRESGHDLAARQRRKTRTRSRLACRLRPNNVFGCTVRRRTR